MITKIIEKIKSWFFNPIKVSTLSAEEFNAIFCIRNSRWKKTRDVFLESNNCCAVCGSEKNLAVHHIIPVHIDKSRELDENNFIVLCQNKTLNCHFTFGHLLNWTKFNPSVVEDAKVWSSKLNNP